MSADLIAAVKAGDAAAVEALLAKDPELAETLEDGISAVRIALYHRQPAVLEALLAAQPPLDGLDHAALGWDGDLRRDVADDPELVGRRSADGFTALHYACFFGGAAAAAVLLEAGADPEAEADNPSRVRPLHSAAAAGDASPRGCCWRRAPIPTLARRAASRRCTPPRTRTTTRSRRCCCAMARTRRCATTRERTRRASRGRASRPLCSRCSR